MNEAAQAEATAAAGKSEYNALLAATEKKIELHLQLGAVTWFLLLLLAMFNVVHWLAWMPGLAANTGLLISLGMQLNRIDELRGS